MSNYPTRKNIQRDVFRAFQRALLHNDKTPLKTLKRQFKKNTEKASTQPQTLRELKQEAIRNIKTDNRTGEQIAIACEAEHARQNEIYYNPDRKRYLTDLKTAHSIIDDLAIGYRAYTPSKNLKNVALFAFSHAALALVLPLVTLSQTPDLYVAFGVGGLAIGALRGAIDNSQYFKKIQEGSRFIQKSFKQ